MWKKVVLRIWMENKGIPLCWKVPVFLLILFGGAVLNGWPYLLILAIAVPPIELALQLPISAIEDLLPRTEGERKKINAAESALLAGIYALAFIFGYGLMFCLYERYFWEGETVFFLVKMAVIMFLAVFNFRMWVLTTVEFGMKRSLYPPGGAKEEKRATRPMARGLLFSYGTGIYLILCAIGQFGEINFLQFLAVGRGKSALVFDGIIFAALCIQTVEIWKFGEEGSVVKRRKA